MVGTANMCSSDLDADIFGAHLGSIDQRLKDAHHEIFLDYTMVITHDVIAVWHHCILISMLSVLRCRRRTC